jgi:hypothetical protein
MRETRLRDDLGVRGFYVFCPAAFATSPPRIASLDLFLAAGVPAIAAFNIAEQVDRALDALSRAFIGCRSNRLDQPERDG